MGNLDTPKDKDIPFELKKMERALFLSDMDTVKSICCRLKACFTYPGTKNKTWSLLDEIENCSLEEFNSEKIIADFIQLKNLCRNDQIESKQKLTNTPSPIVQFEPVFYN